MGVPRYLKEKGKEGRMIRVARFRLERKMRGGGVLGGRSKEDV